MSTRRFKVEKWIFTEAQLGKDDLDCHFSCIRHLFLQYLNMPGHNMRSPADMYAALTYPTVQLENTHVLLGNIEHYPLKKKFVLSKFKVKSVHEYMYTTLKNGTQNVQVCYHGGITNAAMQRSFNTGCPMYQTWLAAAGFKPTEWKPSATHTCRLEKMKKGKQSCGSINKRYTTFLQTPLSAYKKTLITYAKEWALEDEGTERNTKDLILRKAGYEGNKTGLPRITKGWAMKTATPSVSFSIEVRQELVKLFNQRDPYVQPEEAVVQIRGMPEFRNDMFVTHMLTAARVKSYFSRLVQQKRKVASKDGLPLPNAVDAAKKYGSLSKRKELVDLIRTRNIHVTGSLARKNITALVELLVENDAMKEHAANNDMDEDEAHASEKACTSTIGGLDATEEEAFVVKKCGSAGLGEAGETALSQINDAVLLEELETEDEKANDDDDESEDEEDKLSNDDNTSDRVND
jgi:hypothetical protein